MPKARNPNRDKAYKLWVSADKKIKLKDIAARLKETESTIRKWKSVDNWELMYKERSQNKKSAPKKKGPPKGNKNAKGHGAKIGNQNALKHGGYATVYWNTLTPEEVEMLSDFPINEEMLLIDQIKTCTVREFRLMNAINQLKEKAGKAGMVIDTIIRFEDKRSFKKEEDGVLYEDLIAEKIKNGERLPGDKYTLQTVTASVDKVIINLESELTRVQKQKTNCIRELVELRERNGHNSSTIADEWIKAVMEAENDA